LAVVTLLALIASTASAQQTRRRAGIEGRAAPAWQVDSWHQLPEGVDSLDVRDHRGKVVYLFFFQSWCPGCHRHGFPTLKSVREELGDVDDVEFIVIQTVFEGLSANTVKRGLADMESFGLSDVPFGHAAGPGDHQSPALMRSYRSGGTPWTVVIDKQGVVRFNGFRIEPDAALSLVQRLRVDRTSTRPSAR
jgi:thiol-disulfide isomerase/thioredoxin